MRRVVFLAAVLALGCAHSRSSVVYDEDVEFSAYRRVGVPAFKDGRGQGRAIAAALGKGLERLMREPVDAREVEEVLAKHPSSARDGLGMEASEELRRRTSADALLFGRMTPDWTVALITVVETEMGQPVLRAKIRPRKGKAFTAPEEVAAGVLEALAAGN